MSPEAASGSARPREPARWRRVLRFVPRLGTWLSCALVATAFMEASAYPLIWMCLIPWMLGVARCESALQASLQGLWLSVLLGIVATPWIAVAAQGYLEVSPWLAGLALLAYACDHQAQLVLFGPVARGLARVLEARPTASTTVGVLWTGALAYTGSDWLTPKLLPDSFGLVVVDHPWLAQSAELGGVWALSLLVALANTSGFIVLAALFDPARRRPRLLAAGPALVLAGLVFAGAAAFGYQRLDDWRERLEQAPRHVRAGVVQAAVAPEIRRRWGYGDAEAARQALAAWIRTTDDLLARAPQLDFVVWSETAYPGIFRRPENPAQLELNVAFDRYLAAHDMPFVFGAYDRVEDTEKRVLRNGLFLVEPPVDPDPGALGPMRVHLKSRLFPVGESLPGIGRGVARSWLPGAASLAPGPPPTVHPLALGRGREPLRIGAAICYEDFFAAHTVALARQGAELLVNVSNDSWFGGEMPAHHHLSIARLRSIETRLPQVRATDTGYSALVLPTGELPVRTAYGQPAALAVSIPIASRPPTLVERWGDWLGPATALLAIAGGTLLWRLRSAPDRPARMR